SSPVHRLSGDDPPASFRPAPPCLSRNLCSTLRGPMSSIQFALLAASLAAPAAASDWPQWQGPNRDAQSPATRLVQRWPEGGPKLLFKTDKLGAGYGSPAVVGGRLVVLGAEDPAEATKEFVLCLDAGTGKEIWKAPIETSDGSYLYGWGSGPRSTPTIDGDMVYVLGARGDLVCLTFKDGKKVWSKNLVTDLGGGIPNWGYSESVLIDGDRLVCTPGGNKGTMASLDKKTGEVKWRSDGLTDAAAYSSIVVTNGGGHRQYVTQTPQSVCGVRADDGKLLWRRTDLKYAIAVIPTPVVYKDY